MKTIFGVTETNWRQQMWTAMMSRLPASITINMKTKSYAVRDNSLQYIYSDDIDADEVDELIGELAKELIPASRSEFQEAFSMKALIRAWKDEKKGYTVLSQMNMPELVTLRTDVLFGQGVSDLIVELRFDLFDLNSLLPERVYRAENYGVR